MKKLCLFIISYLMIMSSSFGQFDPATLAETIYPSPAQLYAMDVSHTSCYSMRKDATSLSDVFYIYGWNNDGTIATSKDAVAWRYATSTNTLISNGLLPGITEHVLDVEVGLFRTALNVYAIVSYYKPGGSLPGHYCNVYRWVSGTFVMETGYPMQLSSTPIHGRISMDVHNTYGIAIVWQEGAAIKIKAAEAGASITWYPTKTITTAPNGKMPDIAFMHTGVVATRIVYLDGTNFKVAHATFSDLQLTGSTIPFVADDINPAPSYYTSTPISSAFFSKLNIDCPDHYGSDLWSYVYEDGNDIKTRVKSASVIATYNLTNGTIFSPAINSSSNIFPTVAYVPLSLRVIYGWWTNYDYNGSAPGQGAYMSVEIDDAGYAASNYMVINNLTELPAKGVMSFSKETAPTMPYSTQLDELFVFYPLVHPTGYGLNMKLKFKSWGATHFKPGGTTGITSENDLSANPVIYPNPFTHQVTLSIPDDNGAEPYTVTINNLQGRTIETIEGTLQQINKTLALASNNWSKGFYLFRVDGRRIHASLKVIKN